MPAAERNYIAEAIRRRQRILRSSILCSSRKKMHLVNSGIL